MKIIIITTKMPALDSGGPVRDFYLLKGLLADKNNSISLYNITQKNEKEKTDFIRRKFGIKVNNYIYKKNKFIFRIIDYIFFRIPEIEHLKRNNQQYLLLKEIKDADIIQFNELDSYFATYKIFRNLKAFKILNAHNIDYLKYKIDVENKSFLHKFLVKPIISKFKNTEILALKKFDHVITCSEKDSQYFSQYISSNKITVIPNGVDDSYSRIKLVKNTSIVLFMGLLNYMPNLAAVKLYLKYIHSSVYKIHPKYKFYIVGSNPPKWLKDLSQNNKSIVVTGYVKDVKKYLELSQVCICPLMSGSGTRLKILEYMAAGRPVISTSKGAEGIAVKNNYNILITDNTQEFINTIILLINNLQLCIKLGENSRKLVILKYNWHNIGKDVGYLYKQLIKKKSRSILF